MHILAILGAITTILILLKRLADAGIDIGWLNPFLWHRRRSWRKLHDAHPVHGIADPMELTAVLMLATAKRSGDLSAEQKTALTRHFCEDFHLDIAEAERLLGASAFLLGDGEELSSKVDVIIRRALHAFSPAQAGSAIDLCHAVAAAEGRPSGTQSDFVQRVERAFEPLRPRDAAATWA